MTKFAHGLTYYVLSHQHEQVVASQVRLRELCYRELWLGLTISPFKF